MQDEIVPNIYEVTRETPGAPSSLHSRFFRVLRHESHGRVQDWEAEDQRAQHSSATKDVISHNFGVPTLNEEDNTYSTSFPELLLSSKIFGKRNSLYISICFYIKSVYKSY